MAKKRDLKKLLNNPDLEGFKDILDLVPSDKKKKKTLEKKRDSKLNDNFALLNLLELEKKRLEKLKAFFDEKMNNRINFSQQDELIEKQTLYRNELRHRVIELLKNENSSFRKNFSQFIRNLF